MGDTMSREQLIEHARLFYGQGSMVGTAGNLSARTDDGSFWITASGRQKGQLTPSDFLRIGMDGGVVEAVDEKNQPSAETSIHRTIYELFEDARACYHVHSVHANVVSNLTAGNQLALPPLEMIKGFGIWEQNPLVQIAIFENHLDVPRIAREIQIRFANNPPQLAALLIRNHGVTVWGRSPEEAKVYIELSEYIFRYMTLMKQVGLT